MTMARMIASYRTDLGVPHVVSCQLLGVSESWFYKWRNRVPTVSELRWQCLDVAVKSVFEASGGTYGSPRVHAQLRRDGHKVSKKSVEASMVRQGLYARHKRRRRNLTKPDHKAVPAPDLLQRDFNAKAPNQK